MNKTETNSYETDLQASEQGQESSESYLGEMIRRDLNLTLDDAVADINTIRSKQIEPGLRSLGDYLLEVVYGGDVKAAKSRNPKKEISVQKIAQHERLAADPKRLQEALQVAILRKEAKERGLDLNPLSSTKALQISRMKDRGKAFALAQESMEHNYSVATIKQKISEAEAKPKDTRKEVCQFLRNYKSLNKDDEPAKNTLALVKDKDRLKEVPVQTRDDIKKEATKVREAMEAHVAMVRDLERTLLAIASEETTPKSAA